MDSPKQLFTNFTVPTVKLDIQKLLFSSTFFKTFSKEWTQINVNQPGGWRKAVIEDHCTELGRTARWFWIPSGNNIINFFFLCHQLLGQISQGLSPYIFSVQSRQLPLRTRCLKIRPLFLSSLSATKKKSWMTPTPEELAATSPEWPWWSFAQWRNSPSASSWSSPWALHKQQTSGWPVQHLGGLGENKDCLKKDQIGSEIHAKAPFSSLALDHQLRIITTEGTLIVYWNSL